MRAPLRHSGKSRPGASRRSIAPLLAAALALLLTGCLSTGYAYISRQNPDGTKLYFKIPSTWRTFGSTQVIEAANGKLSYSQVKQIENGEWLTFFSASRHVDVKQVGVGPSTAPQGEAFARQLGPAERDSFSLATLRSTILGSDPLTATTGVHVLSYTEFTTSGGVRGSRLVADLTGSHGLVTTFGQVVEVDPQTDWEFGIDVSCRASCWGPNSGSISQILKSWTVKELR